MAQRDDYLRRIAAARPYVELAVRRYGGGEQTADIVQNVMVAACAGVDRFRGEASIRSWLSRIAFTQTLKRRESNAARRRREAAGQWWWNEANGCPQRRLEAAEQVRVLRWTFAALPVEFQEAFVDRVEGRTFDAISRTRAVSIGTAHRWVTVARARMMAAVSRST